MLIEHPDPAAEEKPRLYSRQPSVPSDVIEPRHAQIHADLEAWARWLTERYAPGTCNSVEKGYFKGGRDATPPATGRQPPDPKSLAIDSAVRLMGLRVPQHAACIRLYYVDREPPTLICRRLCLHWSLYQRWMQHCRAMVLNTMRELAA